MFLFRKFWAIYAVVLFLTLMTFSVPVLLFNMLVFRGPKALRNNIWYLHHVFTPTFLLLIGIRLQIEGSAHLDPNRSYIIVGNHRSSLDFIVNAAAFVAVVIVCFHVYHVFRISLCFCCSLSWSPTSLWGRLSRLRCRLRSLAS